MKNFIEALGYILYPYQKRKVDYSKVKTTKIRWVKVGDKWVSKHVEDDRPFTEWTWRYKAK